MAVGSRFEEAVAIMERLRGPDGCAWDREQSFDSIRKYTLEETYEVLDAIERRDWANLREELGDLLLQVLFYAEMARCEGHFTLDEVLEELSSKLIRRHPHVFGAQAPPAADVDANQVVTNWEAIKRLEKQAQAQGPSGRLEGIPRSLPALLEARKLGSAAAKIGFDWQDAQGLLAKLREEIAEVEAELGQRDRDAELAEEVGDLLFTVANLARKLDLDPETTLRDANAKFRRRFRAMEIMAESGHEAEPQARLNTGADAGAIEGLSSSELEDLWARARVAELGASGVRA